MRALNIFKAYPTASIAAMFPSAHISRFFTCSNILNRAVSDLGKLNHRRMVHVLGVISSLKALEKQDFDFFLQRIPQKQQLSPADKIQFHTKMAGIYNVFKRLTLEEKEVLKLAVMAHDLGIPLGKEWDHPQNGAEVVRQLIKDEKYQSPVAELVAHHGEFSNLPSASFPRDLYQLPQRLIPALLLLDFCDATARTTKTEEIENRISLAGLDYFLSLAASQGLVELEKADNLFALRARHGFGSIIFNQQLPTETIEILRALTDFKDVVDFYGHKLRCRFLDLLIFAFDQPEDQAKLLLAIYQAVKSGPAFNFTDIWLDPDPKVDLGQVLGSKENKDLFMARFKKYFLQKGISGLLQINPLKNSIVFLASKLR